MGTPCSSCPKIPRGAAPKPENAIALSAKNQQALWYYHLCQVDRQGSLPADEITLNNNAIIQNLIDRHNRSVSDVGPLIAALLGVK